MILLVRIDNRLLHGQILETWAPRLHIGRVVVADDEAAASPLARCAMTLCLPPELRAEVQPVADVDFKDLAASPVPTLLLLRDVAALARAVERGLTPDLARRINLGNVHYAPGRRPVTPSVYLDAGEVQKLQELAALGFEVEARAVPTDPPLGAGALAEKYAAAGPGR